MALITKSIDQDINQWIYYYFCCYNCYDCYDCYYCCCCYTPKHSTTVVNSCKLTTLELQLNAKFHVGVRARVACLAYLQNSCRDRPAQITASGHTGLARHWDGVIIFVRLMTTLTDTQGQAIPYNGIQRDSMYPVPDIGTGLYP